MYSIVEFHLSEPAGPVSLGDLLLAAKDSVNAAFHSCLDQIRRLRISDGFRRQCLGIHTAGPGADADRKAADTVEGFLSAQIQLRRLQVAVSRWADPRLDKLDAVDPSLFRSVCDVIDWNVHASAVKLIFPCWMIIDRMNAASEVPEPGTLDGIDTSIFDGLEMRIDARTHGASLDFLNQAATLMHLSELVNAG